MIRLKEDDNQLSCRKQKCRGNSHELEGIFQILFLLRIFTRTYIYKVTNTLRLTCFRKYCSESMSAEAMATCEEIIGKLLDDPEYSVDEALLRKYVNKQFNWVQANPIYRG